MDVTEETIQHIASLAKLAFNEQEKEEFADQLDTIVSMVEQLNQLDTEGVPATYHGIALENVYREDIPEKTTERDALLQNAPTTQDGLIKVPAMLDNGEEGA